jgi:RNA polymerase sigma-70 factor, ECF subfamily
LTSIALNLGFVPAAGAEPTPAAAAPRSWPAPAVCADNPDNLEGDTPHDSSAETLMQHYRRGDENAFHQLYQQYRAPLLRFIQRVCPDPAEVEEIAQETWMAVVKGRERYLPNARFVTYLFSIARRRTMDRWRRRGRLPEHLDLEAAELDTHPAPPVYDPERQANNAVLQAALSVAIAALPLLQREAFLLRAEGGLGVEEIAAVTGTNRETAKSRLRFAMSRLRQTLEPWA